MNKALYIAMQDDECAARLVKIAQTHTQLNLDLLVNRITLSEQAKQTIEKKIRLLKLERDYILSFFE